MKLKFEKDGIKLFPGKSGTEINMTNPLNMDVAGTGIESAIEPKIVKPSDIISGLSAASKEESKEKKLEILSSFIDNYI